MNTLYVAGDSFASLALEQQEGITWSEILSNRLNLQLFNIARPGANNMSIAIQLDFILSKVTSNDLIVVFLTDRYRKLLPNTINSLDRNLFVQYQGLHPKQSNQSKLDYFDEPLLVCTLLLDKTHADFYKKYFNADLEQFTNQYVLTGIFNKVLKQTKRFLVVSGGYDNAVYDEIPTLVTNDTFLIPKENFIDLSSKKMLNFGSSKIINHLSEEAHIKIAYILYKHLVDIK